MHKENFDIYEMLYPHIKNFPDFFHEKLTFIFPPQIM